MREETINRIRRFTEDRDWDQFHSPANLAKSLVIEAAELLECFQWSDTDYDIQHVKEELADVIVYSQNLLDKLGLDADEIVNAKMSQNEAKYPVDKAKGNAAKYTCFLQVFFGKSCRHFWRMLHLRFGESCNPMEWQVPPHGSRHSLLKATDMITTPVQREWDYPCYRSGIPAIHSKALPGL